MNDAPIILFDGVCHLCAGCVQFVIKRDPHKRFRFARLQSKVAQQILAEQQAGDMGLDSVILIHKGRLYQKIPCSTSYRITSATRLADDGSFSAGTAFYC